MAANDFYNTSYSGTAHQKQSALPPLPSNQTQHSVSPVSSPFDDHTYPPYPTQSSGAPGGYGDTSYHGTSNKPYSSSNRYDPPAGQQDPFTDHNAIPLRHQPKMDGHNLNDGSPTRYNSDPEQYPLPGREKRSKKKKGWFSGRITWVVYTLTIVQIGVFIGELVKNGTSLHIQTHFYCYTQKSDEPLLTHKYRHPNRHSHSTKTKCQHHDRALALRPHQHGRPLHALHAQYQQRHH
jgi:hypothetical protein